MAEPNAGDSATDGGIPADMLDSSEIGKEPAARGDVTGLASRLGWKPKEEWRGAEDKWLDAPDYIGEFEREAPKIKERVRTQKEMLAQLAERQRKQDEMMTEVLTANRELLQNQRDANRRGFDYRRSEIDQAIERAAAEADAPAVKQLIAERDAFDKLRPAAPAEAKPVTQATNEGGAGQQPQLSPTLTQWMRDNPWFGFEKGKDRAMSGYAQQLNQEVHEENPHMTEAEQLAEVRTRLEKEFPHKFENPARKTAASVASPGAQGARFSGGRAKPKTEADLPAEDRSVMERLVRNKVLTKEQYLKDYQWK